jgi:EmrB/QacA subfamily drug resistance transporter
LTVPAWHRLLVEPARPDSIRNSPRAPWLVVAAVCVGAFMGQLDASIVTLAFPTLRQAFHASLGSVQWVGQAYLLVLISSLAAVGRFADMFGRKLMYTYGFIVFVVGSALCGAAPNLQFLVAFRVVQGLGAAMLQANSVAIIASASPRHQLGKAIGIQGAAQALGLALGPAIGGLLIGVGGWRLVFLVNVPFGVAAVVMAWLLVPRSRDLAPKASFDWLGLGLFAPAVSALLLAVSFGDRYGWASSSIVAAFVAGAVLLSAFVARERRAESPMIDLSLFARPGFSAGIASGLLSYLVLFGTLTVAPFLLEAALRQTTGTAGVELFLLPLGVGVAAPLAGLLSDHIGARALTAAGMLCASAAIAGTAVDHSSLAVLLPLFAAAGLGLGAFTPPNNASIVGSVPPNQSGLASGVLNMTRGLGTSLGLALAGLAYTAGAGAGSVVPARATAAGYRNAAWMLAGVALLASLIAMVGRRGPVPDSPAQPVRS